MKSKIYFAVILVITLFSINHKTSAQTPNWMWAKSIGGAINDVCHAIAVDDSGNVYTTGTYEGTVDFDPGAGVFNLSSVGILDFYILKLDSAGNFIWAVSIGGTGTDAAFGLKVDHLGNVFATGRYANTVDFDPGVGTFNLSSNGDKDIFILKLNSIGGFSWAKSVGSTGDDEGFGLTLDALNNVLVTGAFANSVDFNPDAGVFTLTSFGNWDSFILKLENGGSFMWAVSFGAALGDNGTSIACDTANNVYTTGHFISGVDFDPGAGVFVINTNGYQDIFISKLDQLGNFIWAKNMGGVGTDGGDDLMVDVSGNIYSTGFFQSQSDFDPGAGTAYLSAVGNSDVYITKLNSGGDFSWAGGMGANQADYGYSITADNAGNIYTAGIFQQTVDFDPGAGVSTLMSGGSNDFFISKLDTAGNFDWALKVGGQYSEQGTCIAFDKTNHLYIGGNFMSYKVVFGNDTLTNNVNLGATADIFIAKLDSGVNTSGIETNTIANSISIYPNPANDLLVINYPLVGNKEINLTITDITGKIIYQNLNASRQKTVINTNGFATGVYLVQIQTEDFVETRKVVVAR